MRGTERSRTVLRGARGIAIAVSVSLPLALAAPAPAGEQVVRSNGDFQQFTYRFTPAPSGGKGLITEYAYTGGNVNGARPEDPVYLVVRTPAGVRFNGRHFPKCAPKRFPRCPSNTLVGSGTAKADARPTLAQPLPITFRIYNGTLDRRGHARQLYDLRAGTTVRVRLIAVFRDDTTVPGAEAHHLNLLKQLGEHPVATVTEFRLRTRDRVVTVRRNGRRVRVPLYEATRPCSGSWESANILTFSNGEALTATDTQPC